MPRYSKTLVILHWAMALLIRAAWFTAEGGRQVALNPPLLHFSVGLAVLLLIVPRLVARWWGRRPANMRRPVPTAPKFIKAAKCKA